MARRTAHVEDSLELLLDTITNAFGGILFLALLVVLLTGSRSQDQAESRTSQDVAALADELSRLTGERTTMEMALQAQEILRARKRGASETAAVEQAWEELSRVREQLAERQDALAKSTTALDGEMETLRNGKEEVAKAREQVASIEKNLSDAQAKAQGLKDEWEEERRRREVNSPFPEEHLTMKTHRSLVVRYGKCYQKRRPSGELNTDEFAILGTEGDYIVVTPKPNKGVRIESQGELAQGVAAILSSMDSATEFLEVALWDDSFAEWNLMRDRLVSDSIEYRVVFFGEGGEAIETIGLDPRVQ